jgi:hypothetical protein
MPKRGDQERISRARRRPAFGQARSERERKRRQGESAHAVKSAPSKVGGDEARKRPRQYNTDHQPANDVSDDAATLLRRYHGGGDRDQDVDSRTRGPKDEKSRQQQRRAWSEGGRDRAYRCASEHPDDQLAIFQEIGQRNQEEEANGVAEQGRHRDEPAACFGEAKRRADQADQGLRSIEIGDDDPYRRREERRERPGKYFSLGRGMGCSLARRYGHEGFILMEGQGLPKPALARSDTVRRCVLDERYQAGISVQLGKVSIDFWLRHGFPAVIEIKSRLPHPMRDTDCF